jgi:uncharacterized protein DUF6852/uncharacterized protein DUF5606
MEYGKIIAVTGLPGLFELVSSKNDGAIVRSLDDKTTRFVSSRIHNVSHLESIEVYTARDNVNLVEVFNAMETSNAGLPDDKDAKAVKGYFEKVYPELDFERVYNSDMKKMIKWYSVLKDNNVELKLTEIPEEEEEELEEVVVEEPVKKEKAEKQPKAKKAAVVTKAKEEKPVAKKAEKEQPKKKAATKAKKEDSSDKKKEAPKKKTAAKKPPKKK